MNPRATPVPRDLLRRRSWLAAVGAAALLAACALPGRRTPYVLHQGHWRGRLALRTEESQPQSHVASFELRGSAQRGELQVFNPLGNVMARLHWGPGAAYLRTGNEQVEGESLEALAERVFGTAVPIAALFAWLSGQAQPVAGWRVDLSRFAQGRIEALREQPLPRTRLRVILENTDPA
ncbi:hypothetical protein AAV94_09775 [Lampropedia cohaerens]|uniref:Outer-membrane lipoprotein LolB n=1 Tax=Lampropedia cohaerens TaxID=1610491 RepID=A0A0U1PYM5_9BURK|nr:lipoprotein insertase outer membrane protein LolB [Lampropedia cohaerens]KKW67571.1 hypothetical protein AAV94_09775 [Lampropedia cohaerens]